MQIDRRITNGLAWAGLFVVIAVPVADAVSGQLMGSQAPQDQIAVVSMAPTPAPVPAPLSQRPAAPVVQIAAVAPAKPVVVASKPAAPAPGQSVASSRPAVDSFLSSGKALPSYITGDDDEPAQAVAAAVAPVAAKPVVVVAPVQTAAVPARPEIVVPVAVDPIEVATLTPAKIAPVPMPLSMRPKPVTQPLARQPVDEEIVLPPAMVAGNDPRPAVVDDLRDWESGPLSEFLAQRQGQQSSATVTHDSYNSGYYVDQRPNRRPRRDVYIGPVEDEQPFFPFIN